MNHVDQLKQLVRKRILLKSSAIIASILLAQVVITVVLFRVFSLRSAAADLNTLTARVEQGLRYANGSWDTSRYASDPDTPHPSGSSGFSTPLYIIGVDGFVIERNAPIRGLLDTADFNHLMAFQKAQTIRIITNEQWRILSRPVLHDGKNVGVIVVSIYNPNTRIQDDVDSKLARNLEYITKQVGVRGGDLDASKVDIRSIDYDISFEIVNSFNKVLLNNGRMPTYIDKSYVYNELNEPAGDRVFKDTEQGTQYIIVKRVLYDAARNPVGIVVAGKSIKHINEILLEFLPFMSVAITLMSASGAYLLIRSQEDVIVDAVENSDSLKRMKALPSKLSFDKRSGVLTIGSQTLEIPYASNQYYLCKAVFSEPRKRWEVDELLEVFGHDPAPENWRKVYDAMILLNKKIETYMSVKLIELRDKTYRLNPQLLPKLARST